MAEGKRLICGGLVAVLCGGAAAADALCSDPVLPAGDAAYGAYLAGSCRSCHGAGDPGAIPAIAGMTREDFAAALIGYRCGRRTHAGMQGVARSLGPREIAALAAYFATGAED
ncbi:hypothetical protein [uncultured Roseobacter sp.]|uniref:c-type cytochrome n=1 Tax=uncultured Roseobacter sp. TaxID=114847 RepID=UPI002622995C|nr:hypothetical protein [uncultured Roseobacter sp.]